MVIKQDDPNLKLKVLSVLRNGGIVIMRGDTIYGFFGIAPDTKEKILSIKKRNMKKGLIILIPEFGWVSRFAENDVPSSLKKYWPGPLTIILKGIQEKTVAMRLPRDDFLVELMLDLGKPLYSTSVNISGEREINKISEIIEKFGNTVELIVDSGDSDTAIASTIVDLTDKNNPVIVRQGEVKVDERDLRI